MTAVILAAPGPILIDPNQQNVHSNATLTASGSSIFSGFGTKEISLIVNVKAAPTGTSPTLTFTVQEVDPGDALTVIGSPTSGAAITGVGTQTLTIPLSYSGTVQVSWTIGGTSGPTFTQVYATLVSKTSGGRVEVVGVTGGSPAPISIASVSATGAAVPAYADLAGGTDGTNLRAILVDSTGRQVVVGAGTAGTPVGGVLTIQGISGGQPLPISGSINATNPSVSTNNSATPSESTQIGGSDGTNLQAVRVFDADTGAGTQYVLGTVLRKSASGGSVEAGTSSDPLRIDPTGTTIQPVSQSTAAALSDGWPVKVTDGTNTMPTGDAAARALFEKITDGTNTVAVKAASTAAVATDPALVVAISPNNSITAANPSVDSNNATSPTSSTQIGGSDGTNLQAVRVFDADTGAGTQYVLGTVLRKSASGGSVEAGTSSDPLRVDPTGTTAQPVTDNGGSLTVDGTVTANQGTSAGAGAPWAVRASDGTSFISVALDRTTAGAPFSVRLSDGSAFYAAPTAAQLPSSLIGGRLDTNIGTWLGSSSPTVGQKTMANSIPFTIASDQTAIPVSDNGGSLTVDGTVGATQSGTWTVQQGTPPWQVVGPGAAGAAITGNPVIAGGSDGANARYISVDSSGRQVVVQPTASLLNATVVQGTAAGAGAPWSVALSDGASFYTGAKTGQFPSALVGGRLDTNIGSWLGSTAPTVGQKTMANSVPVVVASDQSVIRGGGSLQSGSYPDPSSINQDVTTDLFIDGYNNLQIRGTVLTDETSFRDDFSGSSITRTLTGTCAFTNGGVDVVGTGTSFTTELVVGDYIRLSAHANTALAQVDEIVDDNNLVLTEPYIGATASGAAITSYWFISLGTGSSISVSSSIVSVTNGTGNGVKSYIARAADYLPFVLTFTARVSQRIANQEVIVGFQDDPTGPEAQAVFVWTGTNQSTITCRSAFSSDSIEETSDIVLPGTLVTSSYLKYQLEVTPTAVVFIINDTIVAEHKTHVPGPYQVLQITSGVENTSVVGSTTTLNIDSLFFQNTDQVQIGNIFKGEPQAVQGVSGGVPITVQFGNPGGGTALPKMVNLNFVKTEGALVANVFKRVLTYTVPSGYNGFLIKFTSFQGEAAASRLVAETNLGTQTIATNTFTAGTSYASPQWAAIIQAEVTTAIQSGSGNVTLTVTYTNESGTSGRTGSISIPRASVVGSRWDLTLQAGDLGVQLIQTISNSPSVTGVVKILGLIQLGVHQDQSTTTQTETIFAPGAITFPTGTVIGVEYAGGTVAKSRNLDLLIQLVDS